DGTAWYHPMRLSIDSGAVAAGNANPAQQVLDVHATHGDDLRRGLRIYAFGAQLGGQDVLDAASALADQSGIPGRNLKLVNREATYSHNDPNSAFPKNAFVKKLSKFLGRLGWRPATVAVRILCPSSGEDGDGRIHTDGGRHVRGLRAPRAARGRVREGPAGPAARRGSGPGALVRRLSGDAVRALAAVGDPCPPRRAIGGVRRRGAAPRHRGRARPLH